MPRPNRLKITPSEIKKEQCLNIVSHYCINIKTASNTILELFKKYIILIQEHWLYECQVSMLGEISDKIGYAGKGVDINNQIEPIQMQRGYGWVAILWRKEIDNIIRPLTHCREMIQCIELTLKN